MATLDLDALRAAREEERAKEGVEPRHVRFGGETYELPDEMPLAVGMAMIEGDNGGAAEALLGADQFKRFLASEARPTADDVWALLTNAYQLYVPGKGDGEGESSASPHSSPDDGTRSRPTANGSTGSTPAKRSPAKKATGGRGKRSA